MRKLGFLVILLAGVFSLSACDDPLDLDINTDPNAATEVQGDLLMPHVLATIASNRTIEFGQTTTIFSQIWVSNGSTGVFTDPERYIISSFTTGNSWFAFYNAVLKNMNLMKEQALAAEPPRNNVAAQAEILSAYTFWMLTAMWGEIPYTEALDAAEFPQPAFDEQETVLRGLLDDLDRGLALIDAAAGGPAVTDGDLIYGGDMELWERFANSLKLRILMMIRNRDPSVDTEIQALLNEPLIRTLEQEAQIPFFVDTGNENSVWQLCSDFSGFEGDGCIWFGPSTGIVDLMNGMGTGDPRLETYFTPSPFTDAEEVIGQTPGVFDFGDDTGLIHQNIVRRDFPSRILTAAEVWLYEAEFLASQGNLAGAHTSYMRGVELGLDFFDGKPGDIDESEEDEYLASLPSSFVTQGGALEAIWGQEYIEVFNRSPENWVHWKRTHYPDLPLPVEATLGDIIRRFPLPPDELTANPNAPSQVQQDAPMWFEPQN